jgi:hypothetical protein
VGGLHSCLSTQHLFQTQAMAFVLIAQVGYRDLARTQGHDDLLGFADRHSRVVGTMDYHQRGSNTVHVVYRPEAFQQLSVLLGVVVLRDAPRRRGQPSIGSTAPSDSDSMIGCI